MRTIGLVWAALILGGCAADAGLAARLGGEFALNRADEAVPVTPPAPAAPVVVAQAAPPAARTVVAPIPEPVAPPPAPATLSTSGGGGSSGGVVYSAPAPAAAQPTSLTISLAGFLQRFGGAPGHYRLQSVGSNVDHIIIVAHQDGQPDQTQTLAGSTIRYDGSTSATFTGLADGNVTLSITAYDASGNVLGTANQAALVAPGKTNRVDTSVDLGHNEILTVKTPLEDGGASGAAAPASTGEVLDSFWGGTRLAAGPAGSVFVQTPFFQQVGGNIHNSMQIFVRRVAPDGTVQGQVFGGFSGPANEMAFVQASGNLWIATRAAELWPLGGDKKLLGIQGSWVATAANGDAFFSSGAAITRMAPDGTKTPTTIPGAAALAVDAADNVWTTWKTAPTAALENSLRKYAPDGTLVGTTPLAHRPDKLLFDGQGNLWAMDGNPNSFFAAAAPGTALSKIAPDGTVSGPFPVQGRQMAAHAAGNLWVTGTALTKLSPTGAVLGTFPIDSAGVAVASDGIIWVTGAKTRQLYKLAP